MDLAVTNPLLLYGIIGGIIILLVIIAVLYLKKKQQAGHTGEKAQEPKTSRLAYQPEARPIQAISPAAIPRPVQKTATLPKPKDISILKGRNDISESMLALVDKYSLDGFTIATSDGLVFASSGGETAQTDAAQYSEMYTNDPLSETPGVVLSGLKYKGSDLIIIIRTVLPVPEQIQQSIESDTKDILNWWV